LATGIIQLSHAGYKITGSLKANTEYWLVAYILLLLTSKEAITFSSCDVSNKVVHFISPAKIRDYPLSPFPPYT